MEIIHYDIIVTGLIVNIGFSFQIMKIADEMGIHGFATYLDNETLRIEAEGNEELLNEFIVKCKTGIPEASITKLSVEQSLLQNYNDFTITNNTNN